MLASPGTGHKCIVPWNYKISRPFFRYDPGGSTGWVARPDGTPSDVRRRRGHTPGATTPSAHSPSANR